MHAFITPLMRADWRISGRPSYKLPNRKPSLLHYGARGTRPWAWWNLEDHPPRADGETEEEYLMRHDLWLRGERQQFATAGMQIEACGFG